ncbi:MAG: PAS domain S-box protein [bacterium]
MKSNSGKEVEDLLHELQVHQSELEMQNDELRRTQGELEASRARYFELYDLAPVAYLTLDENGIILEANLTAAKLLGMERSKLVGQRMSSQILPEDQDTCYLHQKALFHTGEKQVYEVRLLPSEGASLWVRIEAEAGKLGHEEAAVCRAALIDISEKKKSEQTLQRSLSLFDSIDEVIYVADMESYEILFVNKTMQRIFEKPLVGGVCYREFQGLDRPCPFCTNSIIRKAGHQPHRWEHHNPVANRDFAIVDRMIPWSDGREVRLELATDITARKQAEAALRESEERFRTLYENSTIGLYRTTPDGRLLLVNPNMVEMLGFASFEEILARNLQEEGFATADERARFLEAIERDGQVKGFESAWTRKDGTIIFLRESACAIRDSQGNTLYYDGTVEDITDRKQSEEALRKSEEKHRLLVETMLDGVYWSSHEGRFLEVNPAMVRMLGFGSRDELLAIDIKSQLYFSPEERESTSLDEKHEEMSVFRLRKKDGSEIWVEAHGRQVINDEGVVLYHQGVLRDITERRKVEEALRVSEQAARQTAEQLRIVNKIGLKMTAGLDFEPLMETIYEQCRQIGEADTFYVALYDDATRIVSFPFFYKDGKRRFIASRGIKENSGLAGHIIESRQTLYLPDESNLPAELVGVWQPGMPTMSFIGVPLFLRERIVGVLSMQSRSLNAYSPVQIKTLELLAVEVAIAIQNSQLYTQVQGERNLANALIDNLPGVFCLVNQQGRVVRWNKYAETLSGYTPVEIGAMDFLSVFPVGEQARLAALNAKVFAGGQVTTDTQVIAAHDEKMIPIYATGTSVQVNNEAHLLIMGIDLTERKQAEAELAKLNLYNDLILRSVAEGILGIDLQGNHTFVNPAAARMLGYEDEELLGRPSHSTWHHHKTDGSVFPEEECTILAACRDGKVHRKSTDVFWRKDGASFPVEYASTPIYEQDRSVGTVLTFIDITERKQLEQTMEKARADFLFAVSHELKTPLLVMGATQEMIEALPEERQAAHFRQYGDIWRRNLMRLRFIIENLVDSQRPDKMGLKLEKRPTDLLDLTREIIAELEPVASACSVQFHLQGGTLPLLSIDRRAVMRLLENLLVNAIKFSHHGGLVEIRLRAQEEGVCLEICDSGMGIDPQIKPFIFQPFYRSPEALKAGVQGTGLGLYVVRLIVESHGGTIQLESEPGKGTTVAVQLPWGKA